MDSYQEGATLDSNNARAGRLFQLSLQILIVSGIAGVIFTELFLADRCVLESVCQVGYRLDLLIVLIAISAIILISVSRANIGFVLPAVALLLLGSVSYFLLRENTDYSTAKESDAWPTWQALTSDSADAVKKAVAEPWRFDLAEDFSGIDVPVITINGATALLLNFAAPPERLRIVATATAGGAPYIQLIEKTEWKNERRNISIAIGYPNGTISEISTDEVTKSEYILLVRDTNWRPESEVGINISTKFQISVSNVKSEDLSDIEVQGVIELDADYIIDPPRVISDITAGGYQNPIRYRINASNVEKPTCIYIKASPTGSGDPEWILKDPSAFSDLMYGDDVSFSDLTDAGAYLVTADKSFLLDVYDFEDDKTDYRLTIKRFPAPETITSDRGDSQSDLCAELAENLPTD